MIKLIVDFRNFAKAPKSLKLKIHRTIILPVVLYGCETWSLTLREKPRVRRTFVPKRDGVTGEWRTLHNEELYVLYASPNIIRVIKFRRLRWAGHVVRRERKEVHTCTGVNEKP
jgi:hypothetical protein